MEYTDNGSESKISKFFGHSQKDVKHFLIVGGGKFGSAIAEELSALGQKVTVIDKDQEKINSLNDKVDEALTINAVNEKELEVLNFEKIDHCVVSTGSDVNDSYIITLNLLRAFGDKKDVITIKAFDDRQQTILNSMGIEKFIRTEKTLSRNEALKLVYTKVSNLIDIALGNVCYQVKVRNTDVHTKSIRWLEEKFNNQVKVVYIAKDEITWPKPDTKIMHMSNLIVVSSIKYVKKFSSYLSKDEK